MSLFESRNTFPRSLDVLGDMLDWAQNFVRSIAPDDAAEYVVLFVLEELFTNTVRHNAKGTGDIQIILRRSDKDIRLTVTDPDSDPFDPREPERGTS